MEHAHASPGKAMSLLSESAQQSAKKYKFRPVEQTEDHFVLCVLMGDRNWNVVKTLQAFKETLTSPNLKHCLLTKNTNVREYQYKLPSGIDTQCLSF